MIFDLWFAISRVGTDRRAASRNVVLIMGLLINTAPLCAQPFDAAQETDNQTVQMLLEKIERLEANQKQMQARIEQLEKEHGETAAPTISAPIHPEFTANPGAKSVPAKPDSPPSKQPDQGETSGPENMDVNKTLLNIRGFGDFGLYGGTQKGQTTSFGLGELNLFITSNISDRFKFLTELVFELHRNNNFEEDLERVLLEYSVNDYLKLSAGRYHSAIGYYNTAYHHTTWFQTTTERPFLFKYEDQEGILPIHNVGVVASGLIPSRKLGLHYVAEVGNGRASSSLRAQAVQNFVDENNHKSLNLALFARPEAIPDSQIGISVYRDVLYPLNSVRISETIVDAYAVLSRPSFEWLNEALLIRHAPQGLHVYETPGFYSQISKAFGPYRPYLRYEYVNAPSNEPVFPQVGLRTGPSVGIRLEAGKSVALKLQYDHSELRRQQVINGIRCQQRALCAPNALGVQVGFTF